MIRMLLGSLVVASFTAGAAAEGRSWFYAALAVVVAALAFASIEWERRR